MRIRDWYWQGWERGPAGEGSPLVYTGEYYALPAGRPKLAAGLSGAALLALYAVLALRPTAGGMWRVAAIPQLLELIPLMYLVMGLVRLLAVRGPMTYRDWHASWRRLGRAAPGSLVCTAAMALAQIAFLVLYADAPGPELLYLFGELLCVGLSLFLALYVRRHPCPQSIKE